MVGSLERFAGETGDLSPDLAGGGSAVCAWGWGAGVLPDVDADGGEFLRLSGVVLLHHVQSLPHPAGGAADAGGRADGRGV